MIITASTIYPEAGINFPVSYKFNKLLKEKLACLREDFVNAFQAKHGEEYSLGIVLPAKSNITNLLTMRPSVSRRYKIVDYVLYIPFDIINSKERFFLLYVDAVCVGVLGVLSKSENCAGINDCDV